MSLFHTAPYSLTPRDDQAFMLKEITARVLATSKLTHGAFSLAELILPDGFATQVHFHLAEDAAVYVLQGELSVLCHGVCIQAAAGAFVFLPRGIPHRLTVIGRAPATVLCLAVPAGLEGFMVELDGLQDHVHNAVSGMDRLGELAARDSIEVLEPWPQEGELQP